MRKFTVHCCVIRYDDILLPNDLYSIFHYVFSFIDYDLSIINNLLCLMRNQKRICSVDFYLKRTSFFFFIHTTYICASVIDSVVTNYIQRFDGFLLIYFTDRWTFFFGISFQLPNILLPNSILYREYQLHVLRRSHIS